MADGIRYYDRDTREISQREWLERFDDKVVALTNIGDVRISTVWLGMDMAWGEGPPLIFETMIWGGRVDQLQWRYSTEAEALEGHEAAVMIVKVAGNHE